MPRHDSTGNVGIVLIIIHLVRLDSVSGLTFAYPCQLPKNSAGVNLSPIPEPQAQCEQRKHNVQPSSTCDGCCEWKDGRHHTRVCPLWIPWACLRAIVRNRSQISLYLSPIKNAQRKTFTVEFQQPRHAVCKPRLPSIQISFVGSLQLTAYPTAPISYIMLHNSPRRR